MIELHSLSSNNAAVKLYREYSVMEEEAALKAELADTSRTDSTG